jgi:hypothetical protein
MTEDQKIKLAQALNGEKHFNTLAEEIKIRADVAKILYKEYRNLQDMRDEIVRYNIGKTSEQRWDPKNIDTHFHKRAFYQAGQLGETAKNVALWAGRRKEDWDWLRNQLFTKMTTDEIDADRRKDLQNNQTAAIMGALHPEIPVDVAIPVPEDSTVKRFWYTMEAKK